MKSVYISTRHPSTDTPTDENFVQQIDDSPGAWCSYSPAQDGSRESMQRYVLMGQAEEESVSILVRLGNARIDASAQHEKDARGAPV